MWQNCRIQAATSQRMSPICTEGQECVLLGAKGRLTPKPEDMPADERIHARSITLSSNKIGLIAKIDLVQILQVIRWRER